MPGGGEKTEKATPRRRQKAREKGQVAKSRELTGGVVTLSIVIYLYWAGPVFVERIGGSASRFFALQYGSDPFTVLRSAELEMFYLLFPLLATAMITAIVCELAQVGFLFKSLDVNFAKLDPMKGIGRLFSSKSISEFFKSLIKFAAGVLLVYLVINSNLHDYPQLMTKDFNQIMAQVGYYVIWALIYGLIYIMIVAIISYLMNIWTHEKSLKMSKQEIKEEVKETEGDPKIKSRIRKVQREMSRKRMMSEVPKATVVITNPTHIAVALLYKDKVTPAPKLIAKGEGYVAQKIKEIAKAHNIPIVEDKALARLLIDVKLNGYIPSELYKAVAKVLAYIYKLKRLV